MLSALLSRAVPRCAVSTSRLPTASRLLHNTAAALQVAPADPAGPGEDAGADREAGAGGKGGFRGKRPRTGRSERTRQGRPFLDPRASRRIEAIRSDPMHTEWGGMIDILEHAAYCDGQREEDPDGFFFDNTRPEYDSDCDGDPFSNGYLTEDEYEFPEEYAPQPYIPGRVGDAIYAQWRGGVPLPELCRRFALPSARVTAIINLKTTEPGMKAAGMYDERLDAQLEDLYKGRFGAPNWKKAMAAGPKTASAIAAEASPGAGAGAGAVPAKRAGAKRDAAAAAVAVSSGEDFDAGVKYQLLPDDQVPDDAMPVARRVGTVLRVGHRLPIVPPPPKAQRTHDSKFVIRDTSGRRNAKTVRNPVLTSDFSGAVRLASNVEAVYRSWETRYWAAERVKGAAGYPFADEEADKAAKYRIPP